MRDEGEWTGTEQERCMEGASRGAQAALHLALTFGGGAAQSALSYHCSLRPSLFFHRLLGVSPVHTGLTKV